jgi:glutamyl-tRNA synthetase
MSSVRVRFAPSPTGLLHIGGARTALFNWLHARHTGGQFVLRIEDTDAARNTEEAVRVILDGLTWLGLDWDEGPGKDGGHGPYFQSQRSAIYQRHLDTLLASGRAYRDENGAVRFPLPRQPLTVHDAICGEPTFDLSHDPDMTLQRPDGSFIFHFVNVVDDLEMGITHVIRGEDHLSNTPKHLALYEALGAQPPVFAHIPLILRRPSDEEKAAHEIAVKEWDADKKAGKRVGERPKLHLKMSKRDRGASLEEYIELGYVPAAVRNYLCLLGWSPKDNRDLFPIEDAIAKFELSGVNRSNAHFDLDKLFWMNGEYIRAMDDAAFAAFARPILERAGIDPGPDEAYLRTVTSLLKEKIKVGRDIPDWCRYFFSDDFPIDETARREKLEAPGARENLQRLADAFAALPTFDAASLEAALKQVAAETGQKNAVLVHPCRVAVSGTPVGPSLYHMLEVLGRDRVLARLRR